MAGTKRTARKVVLVGESRELLDRTAFLLTSAGYQALVRRFDDSTFSFIHSLKPDVVVLENIAPWRTVLQLLTRFRADFALHQMAVLITTEEEEAPERASWLRQFHYDLLRGPVEAQQLSDHVKRTLEGNSHHRARIRA